MTQQFITLGDTAGIFSSCASHDALLLGDIGRPVATIHSTNDSDILGGLGEHTHPFNGPFSGTTRVSRYQKGKTNLDFTEARDSQWQWHQLGHMQVCISFQTDNHASTPQLFFTGRMPFLTPNQQRHSTEGRIRRSRRVNLDTVWPVLYVLA